MQFIEQEVYHPMYWIVRVSSTTGENNSNIQHFYPVSSPEHEHQTTTIPSTFAKELNNSDRTFIFTIYSI